MKVSKQDNIKLLINKLSPLVSPPKKNGNIHNSIYEWMECEAPVYDEQSYSEYSSNRLVSGKFGIVEHGAEHRRMFVILADNLFYTPNFQSGWAYCADSGIFSFDLQTGIKHSSWRVVYIENTTDEIAHTRFETYMNLIHQVFITERFFINRDIELPGKVVE